MLCVYIGSDDFSKRQAIGSLALKLKAETEFFIGGETTPQLRDFFGQDLFSQTKVVVLQNLLEECEYDKDIAQKLAASKNVIIFEENKVDKRSASNKQWLAHKGLEVKEFFLPHGTQLDDWILGRTKDLGGAINKTAAAILAKKLGRDEAVETKFGGKVVEVKEAYDLWQADSELRKLIAYVSGREITETDVNNLVFENREVDVFALTSAIADGQKNKAADLLNEFLKNQNAGDEKGSVIKLNALLGEQFRNVAMIQDFMSRKISEDRILESTGWKSGRLFVMKKIASRFPAAKIIELLNKLEALDGELKTGSTPPRVLLDLILSQLLI